MEQELTAGLRKGQIAQLIENGEVQPGQMIGDAALTARPALALETVYQVDDIEEAAASAGADAGRATAMARCVLPVPVPPTRTTLRC